MAERSTLRPERRKSSGRHVDQPLPDHEGTGDWEDADLPDSVDHQAGEPSALTAAIAAHRAAWQAYQDAPCGPKGSAEYRLSGKAECAMGDAMDELLRTAPKDKGDLQALRDHMNWFVAEEAEYRDSYLGMFTLHAVLELAAAP